MYWLILIAAGLFECGFTTCLKLSDGLSKLGWSVAFILLSIVSFGLLTLAAQKISLGTAYAVWTGIGAFGTAPSASSGSRIPRPSGAWPFSAGSSPV